MVFSFTFITISSKLRNHCSLKKLLKLLNRKLGAANEPISNRYTLNFQGHVMAKPGKDSSRAHHVLRAREGDSVPGRLTDVCPQCSMGNRKRRLASSPRRSSTRKSRWQETDKNARSLLHDGEVDSWTLHCIFFSDFRRGRGAERVSSGGGPLG